MASEDKHDRVDPLTLVNPPSWVAAPDASESRAVARFREALSGPATNDSSDRSHQKLGRYQLGERIGAGGMGTVYRAVDEASGETVAIKVIGSSVTGRPELLARFQKEARLLAEVTSRFATRLYEVGEERGIHFLAVEFVAGGSVADLIHREQRLPETTALRIVADAARGLADIHPRGIIHRDIKPANLLLVKHTADDPQVKLTDFGLARHVIQTESLDLTRSDALVGTPVYMSPEQCSGGADVDARTDIYSLGATLFHLLAGRPPFVSSDVMQVVEMHRHTLAPRLTTLNSEVSEGASQVVAKALEKRPELRYTDANELLDDLNRLLRGEATSITAHPQLPSGGERGILDFEFTWDLTSSPHELWPHVSNTERLNQAIGLPAVDFTAETGQDGGLRRFGNVRFAGMPMRWREHPFEWIEEKRMGVLREFPRGPLRWVISVVEMTGNAGGGTRLTHRFRVSPRGLLGRVFANLQMGVASPRALDRVYRRIDGVTQRTFEGETNLDPFRSPNQPSRQQRERLERILDALGDRSLDAAALLRVADFVRTAPPQELGRIKPIALARHLGLPTDRVLDVCMHGARVGLLILGWDVICPVCRIASESHDTLAALRAHGRCEACNADFRLDLANSVELIFKAHPQIRQSETGRYCIGGPVHSPHVAAQTRVAPGERVELGLQLGEGPYQIRGPQLPYTIRLEVRPEATRQRLHLEFARQGWLPSEAELQEGSQVIVVSNDYDREILVRVEGLTDRRDIVTAAQALAMPLFREFFPGEIIGPRQLACISQLSFVATISPTFDELSARLGDTGAHVALQDHFRQLSGAAAAMGAVWFKLFQDRSLMGFLEPAAALQASMKLQEAVPASEEESGWSVRTGIHCGSAAATTIDGQTEYIGATVQTAFRLAELATPGETILSDQVACDVEVKAFLSERLDGTRSQVHPRHDGLPTAHRLRVGRSNAAQRADA